MGSSNHREYNFGRHNLLCCIFGTMDTHEIGAAIGKEDSKNVIIFIKDDLEQRLRFIEECNQYGDYKPFFTDMWDSVVFAGKHTLISFELFQTIQRTYSWMKYYNAELEMNTKYKSPDEKVLKELLGDVENNSQINREIGEDRAGYRGKIKCHLNGLYVIFISIKRKYKVVRYNNFVNIFKVVI